MVRGTGGAPWWSTALTDAPASPPRPGRPRSLSIRLIASAPLAPQPLFAPFEIPPSVPAVDLAEGGWIRFGDLRLEVLHTPGHTPGSVCLRVADANLLLSGDTLFAGGWGRVDLPGGSPEAMVESIRRLRGLEEGLLVLPGHGPGTTIGRERAWMDLVAEGGRLLM